MNKKRYNKTFGTGVIDSPMSTPSLGPETTFSGGIKPVLKLPLQETLKKSCFLKKGKNLANC